MASFLYYLQLLNSVKPPYYQNNQLTYNEGTEVLIDGKTNGLSNRNAILQQRDAIAVAFKL